MMISNLEDIISRFCAYGLEFNYSDGFTYDWCTLIPALELKYRTPVYSSSGQTPAMLEKGWNTRIPADTLRKDLIEIHYTASSFKIMLDKVKHHAKKIMRDVFYCEKRPNKLKDSYVGPLVIFSFNGTNAVQVEFSGELENKHPTFPVSFIKTYQPADTELFPLWNPIPLTVPPVEQIEDKKIKKFIKESRLRFKNQREYLVRYRNLVPEDEWLAE
ncbi:hypothetical protein O181_001573 [Austropuccinia psidii MF-1]|uniref:Uncharacterized protein n=1 Tax=Austropuccinia psidii MF-1 TaxID=1389203 RepID=A0A9Q3GBU5_9BASI|nr:hypothetical protein [Austropuccinia psidii MF-1]